MTLQASADPSIIRAAHTRVREIFLILVNNTLRHTPPESTITLGAHAESRKIVIAVADTGAGIAPEDLPHVFDSFYQAGTSGDESRGTGLGLAVAKTLLEAQEGGIEVTGTLG